MKDIKELALKVAKEVGIKVTFVCGKPDECPDADACCHHSVPDGRWIKQGKLEDFATRLIAAYLKEQKPVAWYRTVNGIKAGISWDRVNPDVEGWREFPLFTAPPEPAPIQEVFMVTNRTSSVAFATADQAHKYISSFSGSIGGGMIVTSVPVISEPAPQTDGSTTVSAPDQERMSRSACAAPSSEEVARMVEKLRLQKRTLRFPGTVGAAANLIERLAARVPDGCVVVPREPTDAMIGNEWNRDMLTGIWKAMIAAGEVKP